MKAVYDGVRAERVGDASFVSALIKCHDIILPNYLTSVAREKKSTCASRSNGTNIAVFYYSHKSIKLNPLFQSVMVKVP